MSSEEAHWNLFSDKKIGGYKYTPRDFIYQGLHGSENFTSLVKCQDIMLTLKRWEARMENL